MCMSLDFYYCALIPISSPFCLGNGDDRVVDPIQKMDVWVRAVRNFCESSTEMSCRSSVPPASVLETSAEQIGPAWYHKNHQKNPIAFSRVMVSLPVSGSSQGQVLSEVMYVHSVKAVQLPSCASLIVGVCFQLQKRQITVRTLSIL